jgi:uncharacterized membrane protein
MTIFSHVAERLFDFAKKLAKQKVLVLEEQKFVKISQKASHTNINILMTLPLLWEKQLNYS